MATQEYGWYSKLGAEKAGTYIYARPDGSEVEVTTVSNSAETPGSYWGDEVCLGPVAKWVRDGTAAGMRALRNDLKDR